MDNFDDFDDFDDFELEVTDLRTGQRQPMRLESPPASAFPRWHRTLAHNTPSPHLSARTYSFAPGMPQISPPNRFRAVSATALAALLIVTILVIGSNPVAPAALSSLLRPFMRLPFSATAMPVDAPHGGEGSFLAVDGVPWGTVLLDGRRDPRANIHQDIYQGSFTLPPGRHTLQYLAAPFPTLDCVVTVPAGPKDTCPLITSQQAGTLADPFPPATRILDLRATPARLPAAEQAALVAATQSALAERAPSVAVTVLPGERYVTADGSVAIATQPMRATFLYQFQWNASSGLRDCASLCVRQHTLPPYADVWVVSAHIRQGWSYATPSGASLIPFAQPLAANIAPLIPSGISATDIFINLYVHWLGRWQVSTLSLAEFGDPYAAPTCAVGFEALLHVMSSANVSFTPISPALLANGCLFLVQHVTVNGTLIGQPLYYFFRFGALLAVNAPARAALPTLPAASLAEQSLARQIATQAGQPSS